jgi:hypothetical protein
MADLSDLLPELRAWNDGAGIQPLDWVYCIARSDEAVAYTALFWPRFVEFDGYVLREGFDPQNLRDWEAQRHIDRQQIELAMNLLDVGGLFHNSKEPATAMLEARTVWVLDTLAEIYATKLMRDFPTKRFEISRLDDENDCAISFCQAG